MLGFWGQEQASSITKLGVVNIELCPIPVVPEPEPVPESEPVAPVIITEITTKEDKSWVTIVVICIAVIVVCLLWVVLLACCCLRKKKKPLPNVEILQHTPDKIDKTMAESP